MTLDPISSLLLILRIGKVVDCCATLSRLYKDERARLDSTANFREDFVSNYVGRTIRLSGVGSNSPRRVAVARWLKAAAFQNLSDALF